MKKILAIFAVAMFSLCGGKAFAQRCLPGMSAVEIKADMADGFYTGNSRNCGYSLGVFYSVLLLSGKKRQNHIFSTNITSYTCFTKKGLSFEAM